MVDSVVEELAKKRLGRTIKGKWRLDRLIGVGGMAAVYAATHRNGARVALKMLHATISASTQIRARFIREGYLANKVDHPGVVRVLDDDIDDTDQSAFLVMDLIVGMTLSDRGMQRLFDDGEILDVAEQVLQVLTSAHKQGIVHRDLKPDNLLVDDNGKVHVLDFGIARLLDDATNSVSNTKTGTAFGTPGFMAPEQAMGRTQLISARTDIYALGATLFALVCGDFVHAAENPQELMVLVATQPARSLATLAPHMAKDVIALIDKSTNNVPDDRWASAEAMLAEVRRIRAKLGLYGTPVLPIRDISDSELSVAPPVAPARPPSPPRAPPRPGAVAVAPVAVLPMIEERPRPVAGIARTATPPPTVTAANGYPSGDSHPSPPPAMLADAPPLPHPGRDAHSPLFGQGSLGPSIGVDSPTALAAAGPTPIPMVRKRYTPIAVVVGGALVLVVVAVVMATMRTRTTAASEGAPPDRPTAKTTMTTMTNETKTAKPAPTSTESAAPSITAETSAAATASTKGAPSTSIAAPTSTFLAPPSTTMKFPVPKTSGSKKPIVLGY